MFGSEKKGGPRPAVGVDTLIGASTTIRGDLTFTGGLCIDGAVTGSIVAEAGSDAMVTITPNGRVRGEIRSPHVSINGLMEGDIVASERIELAPNARVTGNIHYKVLEMAAGAQVNGQIVREEEPKKPQSASTAPKVEDHPKIKAVP